MLQVPENEEERQGMLKAACDTLAAACALPGVGGSLTKEEQQSSAVRVPTTAERAQALSLHALSLHRQADGSCSEAHDVRFMTALPFYFSGQRSPLRTCILRNRVARGTVLHPNA